MAETTIGVEDKNLLIPIRRSILKYSINESIKRLATKQSSLAFVTNIHSTLEASQVIGERPVTAISFIRVEDSNTLQLLVGSMDGSISYWENYDHHICKYGQRVGRIDSIASISESNLFIVSGAEPSIQAFNLQEASKPVFELTGHTERVPELAIHKCLPLLASASYDQTWRLWDIESQKELSVHRGHSQPLYSISWHPDGALVGTGSLDSVGRLWDTRIGSCIWTMEGHAGGILSIDFNPNGYILATASQDNSIKIWDIRALGESIHTIPAHKNTITKVRFIDQETLLSSSFDSTIKCWSIANQWTILDTLIGHENKVLAFDVCDTTSSTLDLVTGGFDRTFKLWSLEKTFS